LLAFFSNISAKNYQNRLMYVEVVTSQSSVVFLRHTVYRVSGAIAHRGRSLISTIALLRSFRVGWLMRNGRVGSGKDKKLSYASMSHVSDIAW